MRENTQYVCETFGDISEKHLPDSQLEIIAMQILKSRKAAPSGSAPAASSFGGLFQAGRDELSEFPEERAGKNRAPDRIANPQPSGLGGFDPSSDAPGEITMKKNNRKNFFNEPSYISLVSTSDETKKAHTKLQGLQTITDHVERNIEKILRRDLADRPREYVEYVNSLDTASFKAMPTGAQLQNTKSANFKNRGEKYLEKVTDAEKRGVLKYFLESPITVHHIKHFYSTNVDIGIGFVLERPFQTYMMSSGFITQGGPEFARTRIGHMEFGWNSDAGVKKLVGYLTFHLAIDLMREDRLIIVPDIMCTSYLHGEGMKFVTHKGFHDKRQFNPEREDIIVRLCSVPDIDKLEIVHDIGGTYNKVLREDLNVEDQTIYAPSALFMNEWLGLHTLNEKIKTYTGKFNFDNRHNTIVFQGHQRMYSEHTKQWGLCIQSQDHMGSQCRDGIVAERCSESSFKGIQDLPLLASNA